MGIQVSYSRKEGRDYENLCTNVANSFISFPKQRSLLA